MLTTAAAHRCDCLSNAAATQQCSCLSLLSPSHAALSNATAVERCSSPPLQLLFITAAAHRCDCLSNAAATQQCSWLTLLALNHNALSNTAAVKYYGCRRLRLSLSSAAPVERCCYRTLKVAGHRSSPPPQLSSTVAGERCSSRARFSVKRHCFQTL
jgi:hypothetical protein